MCRFTTLLTNSLFAHPEHGRTPTQEEHEEELSMKLPTKRSLDLDNANMKQKLDTSMIKVSQMHSIKHAAETEKTHTKMESVT